ncbi:MAG: hypothetical protein CVU69_04860 [Deltaproteobacteria bacterium HGW-Deltaproteobacteria-4]|nr:MAG: hypothetical protein CVU69_04860 [Deltaproteobacteria bacterium HGW-Deltaproteobacteria-4]
MKDPVQLFIDQRGQDLRALLTESGRVLASVIVPGPLDGAGVLQELIAVLEAKVGRKPEQAHLLIADDQVKFSTFCLQRMPLADVEMIVQRSIATATGEKEPIFCLTPLDPQQDKDVFLAEQIPRETITRLIRLFAAVHLRLASVSSALQANLVSFLPHRAGILQAQVIFDINPESVTAIFISPTEILHHETATILENDRETTHSGEADSARTIKRKIFTILNVIHGLYSQYMMTHPQSPVEKVWLCGPGAETAGLVDSLVDAMDLEVAPLDLLAGEIEKSQAFTPLAGLIHAHNQKGYINFISGEIANSSRAASLTRRTLFGGLIVLLLAAVAMTAYLEIQRLEKSLATERSELQTLQAAAAIDQARVVNLHFLKEISNNSPPLYEIFREVAERLPGEIELDGINFLHGGEDATLEFLAVTRHRTPWKNERIFTSLMAALGGVQHLECSHNPDIAMLDVGDEKLIKIKISCRISSPQGGTKR